jgi:hypothetical protein
MRNAAALAMVALSVLALAACAGGMKMSASETAKWLERHDSNAQVRCERATSWDYACTFSDSHTPFRTSFYDVNDHRVTDSSTGLFVHNAQHG